MAARRVWAARFAAPAAFLLAATVAVLLVREGLRRGEEPERATPTAAVTTTLRGDSAARTARGTAAKRRANRPRQRQAQAANYYVIQSGDTYATVAARYGTSVATLLELNPGVDPTQLSVGQRIRVP